MNKKIKPKVSIIMGSASDLQIMNDASIFLDMMEIPFEMNILSAHRTPDKVEEFAKSAYKRGIKVIIAGAGMSAHLPGVIAAMTTIPVIGVPVKVTLQGLDAILSMIQMPQGIPVATVGLNAAKNSAILAAQILATNDKEIHNKIVAFKKSLKDKVIKANEELKKTKFKYKL
jgi:5-(carboxyamino)imidazole ribonucleotide mutase